MSLYSLPSLCASLILVFLLILTVRKSGTSSGARVLFCLILGWFMYASDEFLLINTTSKPAALFFDKMIYFTAVLIIAAFLHLAFIYPMPFGFLASRPYWLVLLYAPALFFIATLPTDYFIAGMQPAFWGWGKVEGSLYQFFRIYLLLYFIGALLTIVLKRRHAGPAARNGLTVLGLAYLMPIVISMTITQILQPLGFDKLNIMAVPVSMVLFSCVITYAVLRQHLLFDMQLLLAPAIKTDKYRFHQKIKALINNLHGQDIDYYKIIRMLHDNLGCAVGLTINGKTVAASGGDEAFKRSRLQAIDRSIEQLQARDNAIQTELQLLSRTTFDNFDTVYGHLEQYGIEALLPICDNGRILGTLKFGRGFSDKIYSRQDFELIQSLWTQLVVALRYIRKLEEQTALKDRLIEQLNQRLSLQQTDFLALDKGQDASIENEIRTVFISNRSDMALPLDNFAKCSNAGEAKTIKNARVFIIDGRMLSTIRESEIKALNKPVIFIGAGKDLIHKIDMRLYDFVAPEQIHERLVLAVSFLDRLNNAIRFRANEVDFVTASPALCSILNRIAKFARNAKSILISGETGTGKELIATYIRTICQKPMISVNCAAISPGLFESAFFGHAKGAFTSADKSHRGYFEQAAHGILFLDEIGELPLDLQAKLLRVIEGSAFQPVGDQRVLNPKIQFIFATNCDLKQMAKDGKFRQDLLYRLDQFSFKVPPLRERRQDIALLCGYYLMHFNNQYDSDARINAAMLETFQSHPWPGNIRQLANTVSNIVLDAKHMQEGSSQVEAISLPEKIKTLESALISASLEKCNNKSMAARDLGIPLSTLRSKLKKLDRRTAIDTIACDTLFNEKTSLVDKLKQYEVSLIQQSLTQCGTQTAAAQALRIPLSTLRSKLKRHNIINHSP